MSRQQFTSRNNIGQVLTFQKSGATNSFDPTVSFSSGSRRVSWKLDNGTNITQTANNSITYTGFTSDSEIRTIQMRGNSFRGLITFDFSSDNLYGHINLSGLTSLGNNTNLLLNNNINLTGITNPSSSNTFLNYRIDFCNLIGNLDLTPLSGLGGDFRVNNNVNLTGITHTQSSGVFTHYVANNCNLTGNLDLTSLSGLGGTFNVYSNSGLTNITHAPSSQNFTTYQAYLCDLTGNLDLTPLSGLGGIFQVQGHNKLTGITHSPSSQNFTLYNANTCNLTGNLNLPFSGLGGQFLVQNNTNLTGITHTPSSRNFTTYQAFLCDLTGNLDLTPLSGLGGDFRVYSNSGLTSITHSVSSQNFTYYWANLCNLTGTLDLSPLTKLGGPTTGNTGNVVILTNPNLTNIIFPNSTQFFRNTSNTSGSRCFSLQTCNLDYVDFTPLSGATLLSGSTVGFATIELQNNNMSTADVNHILVDFSGNATYNPTGWSNVNLNIGGTNANPDTSSGGYDGLAAISFLTGTPYNWTITY